MKTFLRQTRQWTIYLLAQAARKPWWKGLIGVSVLHASCQTLQKGELVHLRSALGKAAFSSCIPESTFVRRLSLLDSGHPLVRLEVDVSPLSHGWRSEGFDYFGRTVFSARYQKGDGPSSHQFSPNIPVTVNDAGFLSFNSSDILIKADELGCMLLGRLPKAWQERQWFEQKEKHTKGRRFVSHGERRDLRIDLYSNRDYCVLVQWRAGIFFSRSLTWCVANNGQRGSILSEQIPGKMLVLEAEDG